MDTLTLIYQHESSTNSLNVSFGFTVDRDDEGVFWYRARNRHYDGIKVVGKFDSEPVRMDATDEAEALTEAKATYIKYVAAIKAQA